MIQSSIYSSRAGNIILCLAFFCALSGCVSSYPVRSDSPPFPVLAVPFIEQKGSLCGPAAVAMVLSFYGLPTRQQEVAGKTFTPSLNASLLADLENYVNTISGVRAESRSLSVDQLENRIKEGYPTVVLVDEGVGPYQVLHYMVVVGIDPSRDKIICHTRKDRNRVFRMGWFLKRWRKMDNLALIILTEEMDVR